MNKFKQWLFNSKFFAVQKEELYRFTFDHAQDDLKELWIDNTDEKAEELSKKTLNDMLSVVDVNSIVTTDKVRGIVYIGGNKADEYQLANLKSEADFIVASSIWKLLHETPKELAQRAMFVSGETLADMSKGKTMLYTLSTQQNILDTFRSYLPKK